VHQNWYRISFTLQEQNLFLMTNLHHMDQKMLTTKYEPMTYVQNDDSKGGGGQNKLIIVFLFTDK
jgi:hypothetical protein